MQICSIQGQISSNRKPRSAGMQIIDTKAKQSSWSSNSTAEERVGEYPRTR